MDVAEEICQPVFKQMMMMMKKNVHLFTVWTRLYCIQMGTVSIELITAFRSIWSKNIETLLKDLYLTLPPQNSQSLPCQPSGQTQVPFIQTPPFIQVLSPMHFPMTTLLQQTNNIKSTTNKINIHFRWLCIECNILNIWAKVFSIFDLASFSLANFFPCKFAFGVFGIRTTSSIFLSQTFFIIDLNY